MLLHVRRHDGTGDAAAIVAWLLNSGAEGASADDVAEHFPDWTDRRINSALNYLDEGKVVLTSKSINSR